MIQEFQKFKSSIEQELQYQAGDPLHFADVGIYSPPWTNFCSKFLGIWSHLREKKHSLAVASKG